MTWQRKRLSDVAELCLGKMLDQKKNKGELRPYLANLNVRWGSIDLEGLRDMRFEERELDRYGLREGDIVMCEGGEPGRCALWSGQVPGMMIQKALHRIRPTNGVDGRFLFYSLFHQGRAGGFDRYFTGATIKHLPGEQLAKVEVDLPAIETQRRIAAILGAYDDLIEVNRRRVAVLEEMARGLFEEWFVRFRFPGHEQVSILDTPNGPLPQGWRWGTLGDYLEERRDKASPGDHLSGRRYVPIECIGRRTFALTEHQPWEHAQSSLQLFERGDFLFGAMRAYFHKVAPAPFAGITRTTCFVLRPYSLSSAAYALLALFQDSTVAYAAAKSSGSTIPYAKWSGVLEKMALPHPDEELVSSFNTIVWPMVEKIMNLAHTNEKLAASRDLLLPRLISGQLTVEAAERELEAA